ncbi:MAG: signal peptidase II [Vicinamibacterales bacterium]
MRGTPLRDAARRPDTWAALAVVCLDQITKALVVRQLPLHDSITVVPGLLNMTHVQNTGTAFGLLNAVDFPFKSTVVVLMALVALVAIASYAAKFGTSSWLSRAGLAAVLGGAMGNLIDRATRGHVVDFVDFYWNSYHFWAFNVADAAITVGAIALVLDMFHSGDHVSQAA